MEKHIPRSATNRAAAHRMRSRLRRASARSRSAGAASDIGSSKGGTTDSTLNRLRVPGSHSCGQDAEELFQCTPEIVVEQVAVVAERAGRLPHGQLAVEHVGTDDPERLLDL